MLDELREVEIGNIVSVTFAKSKESMGVECIRYTARFNTTMCVVYFSVLGHPYTPQLLYASHLTVKDIAEPLVGVGDECDFNDLPQHIVNLFTAFDTHLKTHTLH